MISTSLLEDWDQEFKRLKLEIKRIKVDIKILKLEIQRLKLEIQRIKLEIQRIILLIVWHAFDYDSKFGDMKHLTKEKHSHTVITENVYD